MSQAVIRAIEKPKMGREPRACNLRLDRHYADLLGPLLTTPSPASSAGDPRPYAPTLCQALPCCISAVGQGSWPEALWAQATAEDYQGFGMEHPDPSFCSQP